MQQLSPAGQQAINDVAQRHGFSVDAVATMLDAVIRGNGSMAQFNHVEFSGSGQWMSGGMTMVSDMFNNQLKGRVDSLCTELSHLVANQPGLVQQGSFQSQSQNGGGAGTWQNQSAAGPSFSGSNQAEQGGASLFVPAGPDWWGADLRWPNSTGAQNNVRYAYFAQARRLAIELGGRVTVYDTLDHNIGGFSQQQGGSGTLSFNSQYGQVDVGSLPVLSVDGVAAVQPAQTFQSEQAAWQAPPQPDMPAPASNCSGGNASSQADVFTTLERLADLCAKGVLTQSEYQGKKAELLARL
ncbi:MAG: SHOCT domain-containing protein [Burkholderiales bacterium]|nr:SHOCT domain-containing protein [Burkholderiales bacterium]